MADIPAERRPALRVYLQGADHLCVVAFREVGHELNTVLSALAVKQVIIQCCYWYELLAHLH